MGRLAHALPPQRAAQQSEADRNITSSGGSAADVPPREPKVSDWRDGRAAASTSKSFSGPASGMAGDRGGDLAGAHRAQRPASRSVRQAGLVHTQREGSKACEPRAREWAASPPREPTGAQLGGARWDDWRTRCHHSGRRSKAKPTATSRAAAALRPTCHQGSRR